MSEVKKSNFTISPKAAMIFIIAAQTIRGGGRVLSLLDADDKGPDDIAGKVCSLGANALESLAAQNEVGWKSYLKLIADGIYGYLGYEVPTENPPLPFNRA